MFRRISWYVHKSISCCHVMPHGLADASKKHNEITEEGFQAIGV